jgi:hypothetical protein
MPNIFQKLKQNFTDSSNKSIGTTKNNTSTGSLTTSQPLDEKNIKNFSLNSNNHKIKHTTSISKKENTNSSNNGSVFTINLNANKSFQQVDSINVNNKENNNFNNQQLSKKSNLNNMPSKKSNNQSVLSLIIDSSILNDNNNGIGNNNQYEEIHIFDPDPVQDEADTFDKVTFLDDRSFIVDDDLYTSPDNEVAKINGLARENSCYTINEIPEGRLSKMNSSRASSRSSLGSGSTRTSSNLFEQTSSDHVSSGLADMNSKVNKKTSESGGSGSDINHDGSKNVLLDALLRKFNVNMDLVDQANKDEETTLKDDQQKIIQKQATKYTGEDHKRKQSELQKKINRNQLEKQFSTSASESTKNIAQDEFENIDATSSYDYCPREIKVIRSTGTQMSTSSGPTSSFKQQSNKNNNNISNSSNHNRTKQFMSASSIKLPQNFECKYIGKAKCSGLWGIKNIREPVDRLVNNAKRHKSLNDLVDVEALISEKGIYIVHKSNLNEKNTKSSHSFLKSKIASVTTQKHYQSGLLPISNISYAAQDNIYSKVFSCIVVQERDSKTLNECYSFLCSRNDLAKKMALAITLAFKEYGKLLQLKEASIKQTIQLNDSIFNKNSEPDSFA